MCLKLKPKEEGFKWIKEEKISNVNSDSMSVQPAFLLAEIKERMVELTDEFRAEIKKARRLYITDIGVLSELEIGRWIEGKR